MNALVLLVVDNSRPPHDTTRLQRIGERANVCTSLDNRLDERHSNRTKPTRKKTTFESAGNSTTSPPTDCDPIVGVISSNERLPVHLLIIVAAKKQGYILTEYNFMEENQSWHS
ncbi:hypothetical protein V3C99_011627 [Haemonchus contortus]